MLSVKVHPDKHIGESSSQNSQNRHQQFVEVNAAYEVLSKPKEKRIYDLSIGHEPESFQGSYKNKGPQRFYTESTFEERARAYGFEIDKVKKKFI